MPIAHVKIKSKDRYQHLESSVDHTVEIEGHVFRIAHGMDARIFHHFGVHAVAMGARFEQDIREDQPLAGLGLGAFRKWNPHLCLEIVAGAFLVVRRAMLPPNVT